jgi:nucleoside-diphosphate-sugar epimerase
MVHVHDLADLYLRAAESDASGEVFNATDCSRSTVFECARAASFAAGAKGRVDKVPLEQARKEMGLEADCLTLDQNVDSSKAMTRLGWLPRHPSFVDGVDRYFGAWHGLQKH